MLPPYGTVCFLQLLLVRDISVSPYFHPGELMTDWLLINISCFSNIREILAHNFKSSFTLILGNNRYFCSWRALTENFDIYYLICYEFLLKNNNILSGVLVFIKFNLIKLTSLSELFKEMDLKS